ncbi:MAG TPA: endonuclease/exonuclease/phosphatase family protein [Draconibacterium sp.]|nr:endonuclease/exonuclease/phosphatase family protein [Draconibacterium sp.]
MKSKSNFAILLIVILITGFKSFCQTKTGEYSILFYNVENLFDTTDDPAVADEEFTPGGSRHWTQKRLNKKLQNLSKVILSSGWVPPALIGLCEVENQTVLRKCLNETPLKFYSYKIIHKESPDERGIDVALMYNEQVFYPLNYNFYPLKTEKGLIMKTREILYVSGIFNQSDTVHFFINHWPSRYGGYLETRQERISAGKSLRKLYNRLFEIHNNPKVVIMGDFNDQPFNASISEYLKGVKIADDIQKQTLVNLSAEWKNNGTGTLKYQSQWFIFDQIMVSGSLLIKETGIYTSLKQASVLRLPFLMEPDQRYGGYKPCRTYTGFTYNGGFSDHLPVLLKLKTIN